MARKSGRKVKRRPRQVTWKSRKGLSYKVVFSGEGLRDTDYGEICYSKRRIRIQPNMSKFDTVDTLIHEAMHAEFPTMGEKKVDETATAIARLLRKAGLI